MFLTVKKCAIQICNPIKALELTYKDKKCRIRFQNSFQRHNLS